jgi:hypothetical protein
MYCSCVSLVGGLSFASVFRLQWWIHSFLVVLAWQAEKKKKEFWGETKTTLIAQGESRQHPSQGCSSACQFKYRRRTYHITLAYSPISLTVVAFINFVSIFRCSSSAHNRVYERSVDSSTLVSSLSSHRNPYIVFSL